MSRDNQRHKSFFLTSVSVGALCLLFYGYLCMLEATTKPSLFTNSECVTTKEYRKPLTDAERVAECSMSEACSLLAEVGYYEARNQKDDAAIAGPMFVAMNRRDHQKHWGSSLEAVVYAPWQFSYVHDGSMKSGITEQSAYKRMLRVAHYVWSGEAEDPTNGADHYHTTKVKPDWSRKFKKTAKLGSHIYYKRG